MPTRTGFVGRTAGWFETSAREYPLLSAEREIRIRAATLLPAFLAAYNAHLETIAGALPGVADRPLPGAVDSSLHEARKARRTDRRD